MGEEKLGVKFKNTIQQKGISLRQLSKQVDIDVSTLSRIINGKQKPNMKHLKKLSQALKISLDELLSDMGYELKTEIRPPQEPLGKLLTEGKVENEDIFQICTCLEDEKIMDDIEKQLDKYEQYMYIAEGTEMILGNFENKLKSVGQIGPIIELLKSFYQQFCQKDIAIATLTLIGSGLLYFIISPDVIPDFLFPLGFIDDVIALKLIKNRIDHI